VFKGLSVQGRFFLFIIPLLLGVLVLATVIHAVWELNSEREEISKRAMLMAELLEQQVGAPLVTGDHRAAESAVEQISRDAEVVLVRVEDRRGRVVQERSRQVRSVVEVSVPVEVMGEEMGKVVLALDGKRAWETLRGTLAYSAVMGAGLLIVMLAGIHVALRRRVIEPLTKLLEIARDSGATLDLNKLLALLVQKTAQACRVDRCTIFLVEGERVVPVISRFADGHRDKEMWEAFKALKGYRAEEVPIFAATCQQRQPVVASAGSELIPAAWRETFGMQSLLAVPLMVGDRCSGVMHLDFTGAPRSFSQDQIHLASTIAGQAALAIENARLFAESERLGAEAQSSMQRFSDLVHGLDAIVWEADAETLQFSFISQRAEAILGYPVERWLAEPGFCVTRIHPDDRERTAALCREAISEGRDHQLEYRALAADGRVVWIRNMARVVCGSAGRPCQLRGVMVEITERKRAEQRQATQFAVTRILAESITVGEATSNLLRAICEGVEWDLGELWRHGTTNDVLHRERVWHSPSIPLAEFEEISRGLTFSRGVGLPGIVWSTGQPLWKTDVVTDPEFPRMKAAARAGLHAACGFPIRTGGWVTGVMVFFSRTLRESDQDLLRMMDDLGSQIGQFIERKEAEQALARRNRELEGLHEIAQAFAMMTDPRETYGHLARLVAELVGATKCVISVYDPKERTMVSQAPGYGITDELVAAFRYPVDEVRSAWNFRLHGPLVVNDPALILPFFKRFIEPFGFESIVVVPMRIEGRITGLIYALNKPGGFSEDDVKPLSVFAGQAAVVIENARLFAEREAQAAALQEAAQRLEAKNEELEAFVYTVTHDLRAPLVALQGMASMLAETKGAQLDDEGCHYLGRLIHNTSHMEELIRDLLEFSRVGRLRQPPEAVAVAEVVDGLLLQWGDLLREREVKVVCRDLPVLWGERTRIEQVYQNLIGNALKFLGDNNPAPMIEAGAEGRGTEWECYVRDNGIGIDPAYHGKVFDLFQQLREVESEGTGIGLAIVKKIVELAGGRIWIESEAGKGATFRFTWPKGAGEGSGRDHG
jgi:PAS domain S-box-containing protein